jgi:hypothetical protein
MDQTDSKIIKKKHVFTICRIKCTLVFKKPEKVNGLCILRENYALVPADKASNSTVSVCKGYFKGNPFYFRISLTKDEILQNHLSVLNAVNIPKNQDRFELSYLY